MLSCTKQMLSCQSLEEIVLVEKTKSYLGFQSLDLLGSSGLASIFHSCLSLPTPFFPVSSVCVSEHMSQKPEDRLGC